MHTSPLRLGVCLLLPAGACTSDCNPADGVGCVPGLGCAECDADTACAPATTGTCASPTSVLMASRTCMNNQCMQQSTMAQACSGTDICRSGQCVPAGTECVTAADCPDPANMCSGTAFTFSTVECVNNACVVDTVTRDCSYFDPFSQAGTCANNTCVRNDALVCTTSYDCVNMWSQWAYLDCNAGRCSMTPCDSDQDCAGSVERGCVDTDTAYVVTPVCVDAEGAPGLRVCGVSGSMTYQETPCAVGQTCSANTGLCQ